MSLKYLFIKPNIKKLKEKDNVKELKVLIKEHKSNRIKKEAILALGDIKNREAVDALIEMLKGYIEDKELKLAVSDALIDTGYLSIDKLKTLITNNINTYNLEYIIRAFSKIKGTLVSKEDIYLILPMLSSYNIKVKLAAVEALKDSDMEYIRYSRDTCTIEQALKELITNKDINIRRRALEVAKSRKCTDVLTLALADDDYNIAEGAYDTLDSMI